MNMKKIFAVGLAAGLLMTAAPVMAEETAQTPRNWTPATPWR